MAREKMGYGLRVPGRKAKALEDTVAMRMSGYEEVKYPPPRLRCDRCLGRRLKGRHGSMINGERRYFKFINNAS